MQAQSPQNDKPQWPMSASRLYDTQANYPSKKKHISANYNTKKKHLHRNSTADTFIAPPQKFDKKEAPPQKFHWLKQ